MTTRRNDHHAGLQKLCEHRRAQWSKCKHSWYLRYTPKGQPRQQIKIDDYAGRHIETKEEAATLVIEIKAKLAAPPPASEPTPTEDETTEGLGEHYFADARNIRNGQLLRRGERYKWQTLIDTVIRRANGSETRIGDLPIRAVTSTDIEAFKSAHVTPHVVSITDVRGKRYEALRGGTSSVNRILYRWARFYQWAVRTGRAESTPFQKGGISVIDHYGERTRDRRLEEGEFETLIAACRTQRDKDLIETAINTACRKNELLSLRVQQVRFATNVIALRGKQTKNGKPREIPMLGVVRAIMERRCLAPDDSPRAPMDFVFSEVGDGRLSDVKSAWTTIRLRAAGFTGVMRDPKARRLTPEARQALKDYDLKFHDLRREAGSSLLDDGMQANAVQVFLDHANIATTNRYLRLRGHALHDEAAKVELVRIGKRNGGAAPGGAVRQERKLKAV